MATKQQPADKGAAQGAGAQAAPRPRAALSMEKRLAIAIAGVLALIDKAGVEKASKAPEVAHARELAKEVNQKTIGPIDTRLTELQKEIAEAAKPEKLTAEGGAQALKDLIQEMSRLQNRRKNLFAQATG